MVGPRQLRWCLLTSAAITFGMLGACTPEPTPPTGLAAPSNVTTEAGPGYVVVRWDHDGADVDGFEVHREPGAGGAGLARASTPPLATLTADARSYVDRDVDADVTYAYSVVAFNDTTTSSAAPAASAVTIASGVDIVTGVHVQAGAATQWAHIVVYLFLGEQYREVEQHLTITGPVGWGEPFAFTVPMINIERGFLRMLPQPERPAVEGTYTVVVEADGTVFTASTTLDASAPFAPASSITVAGADDVVVSWEAVEGAITYTVTIHDGPIDAGGVAFAHTLTGSTSHTFSGLDLAPGVFGVGITAWPVPWDPPTLPLKPAAFHTSFATSTFEVVAPE